ncbi:MAG: hypothetical protein IKH65_11235 [Clostridia bacterium]|nr:hypothetical protein [Clostridia bacterium]
MKLFKRILCVAFIFAIAFGAVNFNVFAAKKKPEAPINVSVKVGRTSVDHMGIIPVTVTITNTSDKTIKNIIVTSSDSENLVLVKPLRYNVIVTNPGQMLKLKKDSMTKELKPGGVLQYSYETVLSYAAAKKTLSDSELRLMRAQHKLLRTVDFTDIFFDGNFVTVLTDIKFEDIAAKLAVTAYYDLSEEDYSSTSESALASITESQN